MRRWQADGNGAPLSEKLVSTLLDECEAGGIRLAFHIEPYEGRSAKSVRPSEEGAGTPAGSIDGAARRSAAGFWSE